MPFTIIEKQSRIVVEDTGTEKILQVRAEDGTTVRIPLDNLAMTQLGYHCALWLRERTGRDCFLPHGFAPPKSDAPSLSPRVRVRPA